MTDTRSRIVALLAGTAGPEQDSSAGPGRAGCDHADEDPRAVGSVLDHCPVLALAPIATVTHSGFRELVSEYGGCDLFWSEMTSAEALVNGTPYETYYLDPSPLPDRTILQLVGYSEEAIITAAELVSRTSFGGVDLNLGCSAPHIVRKGGGIAWMQRPREVVRLVSRLRRVVTAKTLSVKTRLAGKTDDLVKLSRELESEGVDFITLHPKYQKESPSRPARWSVIAELRTALTIPVVGCGGVTNWKALIQRIQAGGTGPVMIGRAAIKSPWIFSYLRGRSSNPAHTERIDLLRALARFHELLEEHQPEDFWLSRARRFHSYFFGNFRFGHRIGARLARATDYRQAKQAAQEFCHDHAVKELVFDPK
jgi:tRNA-dihydrouridine synthase B